jgi:hypothetical protein
MAADLKLTLDEAALKSSSSQGIRDTYRRLLTGKVCRSHGRGAKVSEPDAAGEISISGCCDEFVREASRALR